MTHRNLIKLGLIGGLVLLVYLLIESKDSVVSSTFKAPDDSKKTKTSYIFNKPNKTASLAKDNSNLSTHELLRMVAMEAQAMGKIDPHPKETEQRLTDLAQQIQEAHFPVLTSIALNKALNGDERFLSVYLLSLNKNEKVAKSLLEIANSTVSDEVLDPRLYDQEVMIRMQAVEAISGLDNKNLAKKLLSQLLLKQNNISLIHSIRNSLARVGG